MQTVAAVKQAYWTLKATRANVAVQQRSLELAQELARENKVRVDAGQIPPLDLVQAEAEVAQRRENLIRANTVAEDAEDALRRLIVDPADVSFWRVRLDPSKSRRRSAALPDVDAAVAKALNDRYDLARAGHELENARTTVDFLRNQRLPDVRLETSYRGNGLGGTQFLRSGGFPGLVTGTRRRSFGDALGQVFTNDYPTWSFGLTVSYPLGHSFEAASHARAEVERRQAAQRIASLRVRGRRDGAQGRPADSQHGRTGRGGARRRDARAGAPAIGAAPLRRGAVDDVPRHAGAARSARGGGESAADDARVRVGARELRGRAAGAAAGRRRHGGCAGRERRPAADAKPARDLPSRRGQRVLTMDRSVAVIGAPSSIGIRPYDDGQARHLNRSPDVLRERGLVERLHAIDLGDVVPPPYRDYVRPPNRARNEDAGGRVFARSLGATRGRGHRQGRFALVLGGDCSIVLGCLLGAKRAERGPVGLVYLDAHADFATPEESRTGSVASMALGLASGRGNTPLARLGGPPAAGGWQTRRARRTP